MSRVGFGNPCDVTTESGNALAQDFATSIARSLEVYVDAFAVLTAVAS